MQYSSNSTLYEKVAASIEEQIRSGVLQIGDRIPSVRKMSGIHRVSPTTVIQAYLTLERRGLIESRPQSGFYVIRPVNEFLPEPTSTPTPTRVEICTKLTQNNVIQNLFNAYRTPGIVPLGTATLSPDLFPNQALNRLVRKVILENPLHSSEYEFPPGSETLRRQISKRAIHMGAKINIHQIVTTNGCVEAINLCLRAVAHAGDVIAVESPTYYGILQTLENLNMKIVEIPSHPRTGMDLDVLAQSLKKNSIRACVVNPNFNNPTGALMPDSHKKRLVELLSEQEIPIIEDDIYGDMAYSGIRPRTLKSFDTEGWVMLCSSFSKTLAPGYRVGWVLPGRFQKEVERLKYMSSVATPSLPQLVLAEYLKNGGYDRHIRKLRQSFSLHVQRVTQALYKYFPAGTKVSRPEGGFVVWVELPSYVDASKLHLLALREKISISPGEIFSASGRFKNYIRINCGHHWSPKMEQAFATLGKLVHQS
jgi:DNA-binding transcriptional MocR family regulator